MMSRGLSIGSSPPVRARSPWSARSTRRHSPPYRAEPRRWRSPPPRPRFSLVVMIPVGVFGAGGRMGRTVSQAVGDDPELELVAAVDPQHAGIDLDQIGLPGAGLNVSANADAFRVAGAEVAVD